MTLQQFINTYRISTAGSYYERLDEARLFVSDALEQTDSIRSYIESNAATIYDVNVTDI
tara:strand:+ start:346 stop:522 length:177 start_codon:yes stop_codon:yes gene_type:complete